MTNDNLYKQPDKWMSFLDDSITINQIRIPGTHNSGAGNNPKRKLTKAIQFAAQCQSLDINSQLEMGIRYIDIRVKLDSDSNLNIYHGLMPYSISFVDVLNIISNFFERNPSECIFIRLHREDGDPGGFEYRNSVSDDMFVNTIVKQLDEFVDNERKKRYENYLKSSNEHLLNENVNEFNIIYNDFNDNPCLGSVRSKIILYGIRHVVNTDIINQSPYRFRKINKQCDFKLKCNDNDIEQKKMSIINGMKVSKQFENALFVNEVNAIGSVSLFNFIPCPRKMAEIMNPIVESMLMKLTSDKLDKQNSLIENDFQGVLMFDFPELSKEGKLIQLIIAQNFL